MLTVPVFSSTSPGEPTPTPCRSELSTPAAFAASTSALAIAAATSAGPPSVGVGCRASPLTAPSASMIAVWILVPPRSMPPRRSLIGAKSMAAPTVNVRAWRQTGWRIWWAKRRWYERNHRLSRRLRIDRHAARGGFFVRYPVEGEILEALDQGRLRIGEGTLLEPGCWLTLAARGRDRDRRGLLPQPRHDDRRAEQVTIGDHVMFANGCFIGDAEHRFDDPELPITWQGFTSKGPVEIGANSWFGVNCAVTSGVSVGERCVIGANSVVTRDLPARHICAGAPAKPLRPITYKPRA